MNRSGDASQTFSATNK